MAVSVVKTATKVNLKYPAKTSSGLSAYTLGVEVVNDAGDDQKYYNFASALMTVVDADSRVCETISLTVTRTIA